MSIFSPQKYYSSFRKLALAQWRNCNESSIYGAYYYDVTETEDKLKKFALQSGKKVSFGVLVGKAIGEALKEAPSINAKIFGNKIYLKKYIDVFFQVDVGMGQDLTGAIIRNIDQKTLGDISEELSMEAEGIRAGKDTQYEKSQKAKTFKILPVSFLRFTLWLYNILLYKIKIPPRWLGLKHIDPFGSVMVTNVGSFGIDIGFAPLTPWTHVPIIILVGRAKEMPIVRNGEIQIRKMLPLSATMDHRLVDGAHIGKLMNFLKSFIEDPPSSAFN